MQELPPSVDPTVAHSARRYDYWLGGKDNFAADRVSGDAIAEMFPTVRTAVVENRRFLKRAVTHLTAEAGIRQLLDIGTGLPTASNTHEVAQSVAPESRVVYVDNDPLVLVHARALLTSAPEGATAYVDADVRDPRTILDAAADTIDFKQPVGLMMLALLHFLDDGDRPYDIVRELVDALAPGSYLVISHATSDYFPPELVEQFMAGPYGQGRIRTRAEFARFFDGLDLEPPGIVPIPEWRPVPGETHAPAQEVSAYCAVARV